MADWLVKIVGQSKLKAAMSKRQRRLNRRTSINRRAIVLVDRWIQKNFETEGKKAIPGQGWKPLAPATIKARRSGTSSGLPKARILQDTGQLKTRWKHRYNSREAVLQSGVKYGIYHEEGTSRIPKRRILPLESQIMPDIMKLYGKWVKTSLK